MTDTASANDACSLRRRGSDSLTRSDAACADCEREYAGLARSTTVEVVVARPHAMLDGSSRLGARADVTQLECARRRTAASCAVSAQSATVCQAQGMRLMPWMKLLWRQVGLAGDLEVGEAAEQLLEHDADLAAGEVRAEAEVRAAGAEADVLVRVRVTSKRNGSANWRSSRFAEL